AVGDISWRPCRHGLYAPVLDERTRRLVVAADAPGANMSHSKGKARPRHPTQTCKILNALGSVPIWYLILFILHGRIPPGSYITQGGGRAWRGRGRNRAFCGRGV